MKKPARKNAFDNEYKVVIYFIAVALLMLCIKGCGGGGSTSTANTGPVSDASTSEETTPPPTDNSAETGFTSLSEVTLSADGPGTPDNTYERIEAVFAEGSIEAPDLFEGDHTDTPHIVEDTDDIVGDHFVFLAHRDLDFNKGVQSDRQRNEIKSYDKSDNKVLGFKDETMQFEWYFHVSSEMSLTSKFSHFFQLKARNDSEDDSNGNDDQPVITLSAVEKDSSGKELQVRHSTGNNPDGTRTDDVYLVKTNWSDIADEWVHVFVQSTFSEEGTFKMVLTRLRDDAVIIDVDESNIDMWRGVSEEDFIRPKWGIYRSTAEIEKLRADEEQVRFADFVVRKGTPD